MRISLCLLLALPAQAFFSNSAIRTAFRTVTASKGVKWPTVLPTVKHKTLGECQYYDPLVQFPDYYQRDFHAYDGGNLNPVAAVEVMAASEAVMAFHYPDKSATEANEYVRGVFSAHTRREMEKDEQFFQPQTLVDLGCGVGVSTNFLAREFPSAKAVYGIDLSPYFLDYAIRKPPIVYIHRDMTETRFFSNSADLVSISFVLHELPLDAIKRVLAECNRILKPGGILAVIDMCPNIRASDPLMQRLFDRTEPYMRDFIEFCTYRNDALFDAGFAVPRDVDECNRVSMFFAKKRATEHSN